MSGGIAYVFDEKGDFTAEALQLRVVDLEAVIEDEDVKLVREPGRETAATHGEPARASGFSKLADDAAKVRQGLPARVQAYTRRCSPARALPAGAADRLAQTEAQHG